MTRPGVPDERFPKKEHILKTGDFRKAYKGGSSGRAGGLILYSLPNGSAHNRIGFSISSGAVRRATRRNWIRRRIKEIYRRNKKSLKNGFDLVLVVKKDPAKEISYKQLEETFFLLAQRAKVLNEEDTNLGGKVLS